MRPIGIRPGSVARKGRGRSLRVERLEDRRLLAVLTVSNTGDNAGVNPAAGAGTGTLRQAIVDSNATAGVLDTIVFAIANGVQTIRPLKDGLPTITDPVVIDGTAPAGMPTQQVVISGNLANAGASGLTISAGGSTVMDLTINSFKTTPNGPVTSGGDGILLSKKGGNTIQLNFIGTDVTGTVAAPNTGNGIEIGTDSNGNTIGGAAGGQFNVISGNGQNGVLVFSPGNFIQDNFIGADKTGTLPVGNGQAGVAFLGTPATKNTVGGATATPGQTPGNVISANGGDGIVFSNAGANTVLGNIIGLNLAGTAPLGNKGNGVNVQGGSGNVIGGTTATARNIISGNVGTPDQNGLLLNTGNGVFITAGTVPATMTMVQGNFIGTDITGTKVTGPGLNGKPLGNANNGVEIFHASGNTIGGNALTPGAPPGNVISGSTGYLDKGGNAQGGNGVLIQGVTGPPQQDATMNTVAGNAIGTSANGLVRLGNASNGVLINNASANTIGGVIVIPRLAQPTNLIAGSLGVVAGVKNDGNGVKIDGKFANKNFVLGNTIGGRAATRNFANGVLIVNGATGNVIGGKPGDATVPRSKNTISNNATGVNISGVGTKNDSVDPNGIFDNSPGIGIDLGGDGVTQNDSMGHVGPNNFQNFPVLTSATDSSPSGTVITGSLNSTPGTLFTIEFYDNAGSTHEDR